MSEGHKRAPQRSRSDPESTPTIHTMLDEHLAFLPCWSGPVTIEPLTGGITNQNYLVHDGPRRFVARVCRPLPHLGIHRANEVACQRVAASLGLAPAIRYHQEGLLVSDFVDGQTLRAQQVRETPRLKCLAATLRVLHDAWDQVEGELIYFSPLQTIRTYAATARRIGAALPAGLNDALEEAIQIAREVAPFRPVLCHNDLLAANLIDDGERLWLIDWEYGGIGNPLFDLANLSSNCELSSEQDRAFLESYRGRCSDGDIHDLNILKVLSLLRESLWALVQTRASHLEFDYAKYALEKLDAYHAARKAL